VDEQSRKHLLARLLTGPRSSARVLTLAAVGALVVGGATGLSFMAAQGTQPTPAVTLAGACQAPQAQPAGPAPSALGSWKFSMEAPGTFGSAVAGPGQALYALQACGAEETELRVVSLRTGPSGARPTGTSQFFQHAALLTSSLVWSNGALYLGAARLDLTGSTSEAPYDLTVYRLDAGTLKVEASKTLGRGYQLSLLAMTGHKAGRTAGPTLLASTGKALLSLDPASLRVSTVTDFGSSVAQHTAISPAGPYAAVSLFSPGTAPPAEGASLELIDVDDSAIVSSITLPAGADPESLRIVGEEVWASIGDGLGTQVERYGVPALQLLSKDPVTTRLETISLDAAGSIVWLHGMTLLACADAVSGAVVEATTTEGAPPPSGAQVVATTPWPTVVTAAGLGTVQSPAACKAS
jgi:hypothetical protein